MALFFPPVFSTEILEELDSIDTWIPVSLGEQRTKGTNVLRLDRGKVVAYDINPETNARLRAHDIEVLEIEGSELVKGGGGPRCMCLPTAWRD
jgi:arginine deiminase